MNLALFLLAAAPLLALGPAIGTQAPDFTLKNLKGTTVHLVDETAKGPVVLIMLRGFPGYQCPLCTRQVKELVDDAAAFADAKARVILVYPGPAEIVQSKAEEFAMDKNLPAHFEMLLDPDYSFTNLYGLRWDAPKETAYPSTFVLDKGGKIHFAKVSTTHGGRASAKEILSALAAIQ
ncbi:MAG: peroxiredoxin-like family protein [Acidobacteriota bacterium]